MISWAKMLLNAVTGLVMLRTGWFAPEKLMAVHELGPVFWKTESSSEGNLVAPPMRRAMS